jgi:hypothetical protein
MKTHLLLAVAILAIPGLASCGLFQPQIVEVPVTVMVEPTPAPRAETADTVGDTVLPSVDVLSSSAAVFPAGPNLWVDLRIQFADMPFGAAGHQIIWCLNTNQNATSGGPCGSDIPTGTDRRIVLSGVPNALTTKDGFEASLFACQHGSLDWATNTLRILTPLSSLSDDGHFSYAILSSSGDSSASDTAPDVINFRSSGGYLTSQVISQPLPFNNSVPLCGLQP